MTIQLRLWTPEDAPALLVAYEKSLDLHAQFGSSDLSTVDLVRDHINQRLTSTDSSRNWAITVDDVAVGNVGLSAIDRTHGIAWAYYWLASTARGHGYASRALDTVAANAFEDGLFRLELGHRVNNPASCAVATRAGFVAEGLERQKLQYGAERFDVETHARLRTDPTPNLKAIPVAR
ncbi:GNAT family N-acetyltransferase [Arthrobacter sp. TmT3-37]